jgi:mRNA-degrading endonuclease RelE of RelBE toxin-antitoxin system
MVRIIPSKEFIKNTKKLDSKQREKLEKQIKKIVKDPFIGKPLKYRRGERAIRIKPFRLIYSFSKGENLYLLKFDHRKKVYD